MMVPKTNIDLDLAELGIDQIGDGTIGSGYVLSPYSSGTQLKPNSSKIFDFYSKLTSFSLENIKFAADTPLLRGRASASYLFSGVQFTNLESLNLSNTNWVFSAEDGGGDLSSSGWYTFSNCNFPVLTDLNLNSAKYACMNMGTSNVDRQVSSGDHFFYNSSFDSLLNISFNGTKFADSLMNPTNGGEATSGTASNFFGNCVFDSLTNIDFNGGIFAASKMNGSQSGRVSNIADHTFAGSIFNSMTTLSLANAQFAVDTPYDGTGMSCPRTAYATFDSATFTNLETIDLRNFKLSTDNTATDVLTFGASTFNNASLTNVNAIYFGTLTSADFRERYSSKNNIFFGLNNTVTASLSGNGSFYVSSITPSPISPSVLFGDAGLPSGWDWAVTPAI